jgi:hypothetical protein
MKFYGRLFLSLVALFFALSCASAQNGRSTIALTFARGDFGGGRIFLPVRFGNVIGAMRLDTGASTTRITLAPWNKALPSLGQSDSTGASGETTRCDDVEAKNVAIKAEQGNDIARARYVIARCAAGDGDDLLGLDFFKGARFTLDIERQKMVFFGEALAAGRARPFHLLGPDRRLVGIDLRAGDATAIGLFDTGAEITAVDQQFVQKHKNLFKLVKTKGKASEAGGKRFSPKIYKIKELDLGEGRILRSLYVLAYDFSVLREALGREAPFILGCNLISQFTWELDFRAPNAPTWEAKAK